MVGRNSNQRQGKGRNQGNQRGAGPAGNCVCTQCGNEVPHKRGVPCYEMQCPECGAQMRRK